MRKMIFYIYNIDSGQQINSMDIHNQSKLLNKYRIHDNLYTIIHLI